MYTAVTVYSLFAECLSFGMQCLFMFGQQSRFCCHSGTNLLETVAVLSVLIFMVLFTSVLQVDGSNFPRFYPLQKALESALMTEKTLYTMRQVFFPVVGSHAQEVQQVCISIYVFKALGF